MKYFFIVFLTMISFNLFCFAQISPTPVINNEIKDNSSIRRREIELEQMIRNAKKVSLRNSDEINNNFNEIKKGFESIQKLQADIVKTYTTGNSINYSKISSYALEMSKEAQKLNENLFVSNQEQELQTKPKAETKNVRDLIIELDKNIDSFVKSELFSNKKIVDSNVSVKAENNLEQIIKLSALLAFEAKKH